MKKLKPRVISLILVLGVLFSTTSFAENKLSGINQRDLIYFLMTDRFCDGDLANNQGVAKESLSSYHGGDFQGVINKLDYLKDLGFTTIWISPVVKNQVAGYHGYWATDFYQTNEHFGSLVKLKELVKKAHERELKVIFDLVVNHTGLLHPWVGEAKYEKWFHERVPIVDYNNQQQVEEGWLANLPDFDQTNPAVKKYLIEMAKWWICETGIDGYRLDTVRHVSPSFWKDFTKEIKREFPDFYFLGEVFDGNVDHVAGYQKLGLDGLVDFPTYFALTDVFSGSLSAERLAGIIRETTTKYSNPALMGTFIDNHDVARFINKASDYQIPRLKQALTFMMTYTGIPVMYYGTEIGLEGGDDPDNRHDMDWKMKSPLTNYVRDLTKLRRAYRSLTDGSLELIKAKENQFCYLRRTKDETLLIVFNLCEYQDKMSLVLPQNLAKLNGALLELNGKRKEKLTKGKVTIKLTPFQASVYQIIK